MRSRVLLGVALAPLVASSVSHAQSFRFERLADGVYVGWALDGRTPTTATNVGLVDLGQGKVVVFDATQDKSAAAELTRFVEQKMGGRVTYLVNSHAHRDHVGANGWFAPGVEIIGTSVTARDVARETPGDTTAARKEARQEANRATRLAKAGIKGDGDPRERVVMGRLAVAAARRAYPAFPLRAPTAMVNDRRTLQGSRRSVELRAYRGGHTDGDLVMVLPKERIAFMGDLMFVGIHTLLFLGEPDSAIASQRAMLGLGVRTLVPGHGWKGGAKDVAFAAAYRDAVDSIARYARAKGMSDSLAVRQPVPARYRRLWLRDDFWAENIRAALARASKGRSR